MLTKRNMTAELFGHSVKSVLSRLAMVAHAAEDDGEEDDKGKGAVPPVNIEQLLANTRKEEKDKLYPRIKKAEEDAKNTLVSLNAALIENGTLKAEIERLKGELKTAKEGGDTQEVIDLRAQVKTLEDDLAAAKEGGADEATIRAAIEQEYAVRYYRDQQIAEHRNELLEAFDELVTGTTNEEVDKSIQTAIEKSQSVKKQLGITDPDEDEEDEEDDVPPLTVTKKPTPAKKQPPVGNPASKTRKDELTPEDIMKLDVRSPEYAELRKKLGLK